MLPARRSLLFSVGGVAHLRPEKASGLRWVDCLPADLSPPNSVAGRRRFLAEVRRGERRRGCQFKWYLLQIFKFFFYINIL